MTKKILKMAVAGVNNIGIGNVYVNTILHMSNTELVAICDADENKVNERAEFYGIEKSKVFTDYRQMIKKCDIDAICIATKDQVHKEIAIAAMEAGIDVLCEKPMALKASDCCEMIDASDRTGRKLMIGQLCRFTPSFIIAKRMVDAGEIGDLFFVESEYAHSYSNNPTGWRADPDRHIVIGGGCHAVDLLRWIVGNPTEVSAYGNQMVNDAWPYDDCVIANMKFANGVVGKVMVSGGCKRAYTMRTCLYGTEGTIIVDNTSSTLSIFKEDFGGMKKYYDVPMHNLEIKIPVTINNHNVPAELDAFVKTLLNDEEVIIDGIQGCNTVIACEAIVEASKSGKVVKPVYKTRKS